MRQAEPNARENQGRRLVESGLFVAHELIAHDELPPSGDISGRRLVITFAGAFMTPSHYRSQARTVALPAASASC